MCLVRQFPGTMIPHALSVGALVIAVVEPRLLAAPVSRSSRSRRAPPPLTAAGWPAVGLAAIATAADGEHDGARSAPAHAQLQRPSARGRNLDATLHPLHAANAPAQRQITTWGSGRQPGSLFLPAPPRSLRPHHRPRQFPTGERLLLDFQPPISAAFSGAAKRGPRRGKPSGRWAFSSGPP
jgi:hypothetical protein